MPAYKPIDIERKWQKYWEESQCFVARVEDKPKCYVLEMFMYPSGKLHMGHVRNYTIGDVIARFWKAQGMNVLHPVGWDALGLPAENAAEERNIHPRDWTLQNIANMKDQLKTLGFSYDWSREINTCLPEYYMHEQAMFIDLLNAGLAYQKEAIVNWDPVDQTVLANEQIENGRGWRSGALIERKRLKQWFLKITEFADELVEELDNLPGWPEKVKSMQEKWIGKSQGAEIKFQFTSEKETVEIYTTRPETIFGASFIAIAVDHPLVQKISDSSKVKLFIEECSHLGTAEEEIEKAEKKGLNTGWKVKHPFAPNIELPVYIANFVLMEYGKGAVFGCPAHDERDLAFAEKYNLPIKQVIQDDGPGAETLINSDFLNTLTVQDAKAHIIKKLEAENLGTAKTNYRIRDWGISRQRYWGCPIPIIYCDHCGTVPVPYEDLPVKLPENVNFAQGGNPLENHPDWKHTTCPKCNSPATRETDTFDTFVESSWYFLHYCSPFAPQGIDKQAADYWMPVDHYIGGIEHAVMHLLYARFFTKALNKLGYTAAREPFKRLLTQGMILHETFKDDSGDRVYPADISKDENGDLYTASGTPVKVGRVEKMSKSKKNVVEPDTAVRQFGADAVRLFLLSDSPPDRDLEWSNAGLEGIFKYLQKLYSSVNKVCIDEKNSSNPHNHEKLFSIAHQTIKQVTEELEAYHFNKAIAKVRAFTNLIEDDLPQNIRKNLLEIAVRLLNPLAPHLTEELWHILGNQPPLVETDWPQANLNLIKDDIAKVAVQVNGKMRGIIQVKKGTKEEAVLQEAQKLSTVARQAEGKQLIKVIYIPGKIINIICR